MDQIFDSQFLAILSAFAGDGITVEIAVLIPTPRPATLPRPAGLLVDVGLYPEIVGPYRQRFPVTVPAGRREQLPALTWKCSPEAARHGYLASPDALDLLDDSSLILPSVRRQWYELGDGGGPPSDYSPGRAVHVPAPGPADGIVRPGRICPPP